MTVKVEESDRNREPLLNQYHTGPPARVKDILETWIKAWYQALAYGMRKDGIKSSNDGDSSPATPDLPKAAPGTSRPTPNM